MLGLGALALEAGCSKGALRSTAQITNTNVMTIMAIAGLIYPLVGLSMLAALMFERLYELTRRAFARRVLQ